MEATVENKTDGAESGHVETIKDLPGMIYPVGEKPGKSKIPSQPAQWQQSIYPQPDYSQATGAQPLSKGGCVPCCNAPPSPCISSTPSPSLNRAEEEFPSPSPRSKRSIHDVPYYDEVIKILTTFVEGLKTASSNEKRLVFDILDRGIADNKDPRMDTVLGKLAKRMIKNSAMDIFNLIEKPKESKEQEYEDEIEGFKRKIKNSIMAIFNLIEKPKESEEYEYKDEVDGFEDSEE